MNLTHRETIETTYTLDEISIWVSIDAGTREAKDHKVRCAVILHKLLREYRWELFGSYEAYRIINDGDGRFKHVAFDKYIVTDDAIFRTLRSLEALGD